MQDQPAADGASGGTAPGGFDPTGAQAFSYGDKPATIAGDTVTPTVQHTGCPERLVLQHVRGARMGIVHSPILIAAYVVALIALIVLRTYFENPVKFCGCAIIYGYSIIQSFSLFKTLPLRSRLHRRRLAGDLQVDVVRRCCSPASWSGA